MTTALSVLIQTIVMPVVLFLTFFAFGLPKYPYVDSYGNPTDRVMTRRTWLSWLFGATAVSVVVPLVVYLVNPSVPMWVEPHLLYASLTLVPFVGVYLGAMDQMTRRVNRWPLRVTYLTQIAYAAVWLAVSGRMFIMWSMLAICVFMALTVFLPGNGGSDARALAALCAPTVPTLMGSMIWVLVIMAVLAVAEAVWVIFRGGKDVSAIDEEKRQVFGDPDKGLITQYVSRFRKFRFPAIPVFGVSFMLVLVLVLVNVL